MIAREPDGWWRRAAIAALAYLGLGIGSAVLSNDLGSAPLQASIRVGTLLLAVAVFQRHLWMELPASGERLGASAVMTSGAVALGTLSLALYAVGSAWRDSSRVPASLLWALLIWPVATGLPAFLGALASGRVMLWFRMRRKGQ